MKIGIAVTTYHRDGIANYCIEQWEKNSPDDFELIVVKDIQGVARAKNICLKLLYEAGVTDFFLADDDCYPISKDWWKPYVNHKEPYLMYQFKLSNKPPRDMRIIKKTKTTIAYSHTRGAMIYVNKKVLDTVGGMDTRYVFGYEHADWTNRIHNSGLTKYRAMDIPGSDKLFYCLDQDGLIKSSVPETLRRRNLVKNRRLYIKSKTSREYKEF